MMAETASFPKDCKVLVKVIFSLSYANFIIPVTEYFFLYLVIFDDHIHEMW